MDFWSKELDVMKHSHLIKVYPPRVKMTVISETSKWFKVVVRFTGCLPENQLDLEVLFPLSKCSVHDCTVYLSYHYTIASYPGSDQCGGGKESLVQLATICTCVPFSILSVNNDAMKSQFSIIFQSYARYGGCIVCTSAVDH